MGKYDKHIIFSWIRFWNFFITVAIFLCAIAFMLFAKIALISNKISCFDFFDHIKVFFFNCKMENQIGLSISWIAFHNLHVEYS